MKNNIGISVIVALVIGLLAGYVVYPFINPSDKQEIQSQGPKTPTQPDIKTSDIKTFEDKQYGISFEYPSSWTVNPSSQVFESGDVVAVQFTGETQQPNTDFYDGARLVVMVPQATTLDLNSWVNSKHGSTVSGTPPQISNTIINGVPFKKVYTCGLGCFTYYYTVINGQVYGVNTFAEGSQKTELEKALDQILKTLSLPQ